MAKSAKSSTTVKMSPAKNGQSGKGAPGLAQEVVGILLLATALYAAVCLFSGSNATNLGGRVGTVVSSFLFDFIGYTSYVFPFILGIIALKLLLRRVVTIRAAVPAAFVLFIPVTSSILSALVTAEGAGGVIGLLLSRTLSAYIGDTGALILLFAVDLAALLVATGTSVAHGSVKFFSILSATAGTVSDSIKAQKALHEETARIAAKASEKAREEREKREDVERVERMAKEDAMAEKANVPTIVPPTPPKSQTDFLDGQKEKQSGKKTTGAPDEGGAPLEFAAPGGSFTLPSTALLDPVPHATGMVDNEALLKNSKILENKLLDFGVVGRVLEVRPGPVVTMYEFEPAPGIKVGRITNLSNDLALAMKAISIRIIAPIPGKSVVGIEIPNKRKQTILLRELLECNEYEETGSRIALALGRDIAGLPYVADLARMPHLLVAGATGSGKSVSVNAMVLSILFKATPEDVRFLMIDPKMLELSAYEGIPHLITPVITNPKRAAVALKSIVVEMTKRYRLMAEKGARNIETYNAKIAVEEEARRVAEAEAAAKRADDTVVIDLDAPDSEAAEAAEAVKVAKENEHSRLPFIVVIIDELADLMMTSGKDVEECLVRLSQMARASGIHIIIATQRPSVDVVTGLIKTNFPARIAFKLPTRIDSRTILDTSGAETLLGEGDMLFIPPGTSVLKRLHGVYVSEDEIMKVAEFWKAQGAPAYDTEMMNAPDEPVNEAAEELGEEFLRRYDEAVALASQLEMISTSYLQRRFRIGYNTAARLIDHMESEGVIGPSQGSRPREVLIRKL
jgi:S-DNA-T family DNA segregation ATPase FtsK/SpoIIIE